VHPDILTWGIIHIRSYGLMMAIAFLFGTWLAMKEARRLASTRTS
jgi:prolipoprotein diacylglyceryltransferase